jgi:hypothetical protein
MLVWSDDIESPPIGWNSQHMKRAGKKSKKIHSKAVARAAVLGAAVLALAFVSTTWATPVTRPLAIDNVSVMQPPEFERFSAAGLPKPLRMDDGAAFSMTELLSESHPLESLAEPAQASVQADGQKGSFSELKGSSGRSADLFNASLNNLVDLSEVKTILRNLHDELQEATGGLLSNPNGTAAEDLTNSSRLSETAQIREASRMENPQRPRTEEEIRQDGIRLSVMISNFIDELAPWAISALVLILLVKGVMAYLRMQAARSIVKQSAHRKRRVRRSSRSSRPI